MNSRLSTIIDWTMSRSRENARHGDPKNYDIHHTALKHLEALLKAEYQRGWLAGGGLNQIGRIDTAYLRYRKRLEDEPEPQEY